MKFNNRTIQAWLVISMTEKKEKIFHICDIDLSGDLPVERALRKIPGIGFMTSRAICLMLGVDSCLLYTSPSPRDRG